MLIPIKMQLDHYLYIEETDSTNHLMRVKLKEEALPEGYVIHTNFQTQGKGQGSNNWESEKDKNLLFSLLLKPLHILIQEQFKISQFCSIGIIYVLRTLTPKYATEFSIKWPNDIYWKDKKLGGILIENSWQGNKIINSILGIGLNINQTEFLSDAPNPISLKTITGKIYNIQELLYLITKEILKQYQNTDGSTIHQEYMQNLYRREGYHAFKAKDTIFQARIHSIHPDGKLILENKKKHMRGFYFKEVEWL